MKKCYNCSKPAKDGYIRCEGCLEVQATYRASHVAEGKAANKTYREQHKKLVFDYYGRKCSCCSEELTQFLSIDHIDGGGSKHRKTTGRGHRFYKWLVDNRFPCGFQTLCHNCNIGRHINGGVCPHKDKQCIQL